MKLTSVPSAERDKSCLLILAITSAIRSSFSAFNCMVWLSCMAWMTRVGTPAAYVMAGGAVELVSRYKILEKYRFRTVVGILGACSRIATGRCIAVIHRVGSHEFYRHEWKARVSKPTPVQLIISECILLHMVCKCE